MTRPMPGPPECTCMNRGNVCETCVDAIGYDLEASCPTCPVNAGPTYSGTKRPTDAANHPEHEGAPTMSTPTEPNMQIIENASSKDVRPGDHITWDLTWTHRYVTLTNRREGIACHRDEFGDWWAKNGGCITVNGQAGATLTIRRTAPELPMEDGAVIVPAEGHEYIETRFGKKSRRLTWDADAFVWYDAYGTYLGTDITSGTWKVASCWPKS